MTRLPRSFLSLLFIAALASALPAPALAAALDPGPRTTRVAEAIRDQPLQPGTTAVIRADGDCLRLRDAPDGERLDCFAEGSLVQILDGAQIIGDYRWQQVSVQGQVGWMADEYLEPYTAGAPTCGAQASTIRAGLSAPLPAAGVSLQQWGGGTINGILTTALAGGCDLASVFTVVNGQFLGYKPDAPAFVNRPWLDHFGGDQVPAGTVLILLCGGRTQTIAATSSVPIAAAPFAGAAAPAATSSVAAPEVSAIAAVVIDEASGEVLYDKSGHEPLAPASLTKIATAILAIEGADLASWVASDVDGSKMVGSSIMGLKVGDCFQLRDLVRGMMLKSGNDAALAIGRYQAGSDDAFVHQMNTLLTRLGLSESHFANPHGLDADGHVASAYDLALLARYGMQLPEFLETVSSSSWTARGNRTLTMYNINGFLAAYEGADGVKTGFTDDAGRTFVGSATRDGHRLYVVLLDAGNRYSEAGALLDWAFDNHLWQ